MSSPSETELLLLHAMRLKSFVDTEVLADTAGVEAAEAAPILESFAEAGYCTHREGRISGWMLSNDGRAHGETRLAAELDAAGARDHVDAAYRRFLELNQGFLSLCTDWQMRTVDGEQVINDHTDEAYDAGIIERLVEADTAVQPIAKELAGLLSRFGRYSGMFTDALAKVNAGDTDWFTKPMIESYHTVWFELHEDLLASLGIDRAKEGHA